MSSPSKQSVTGLAEALDEHYTRATDEVALPPPRFRAQPAGHRPTMFGWAAATAALVFALLLAGWVGAQSAVAPPTPVTAFSVGLDGAMQAAATGLTSRAPTAPPAAPRCPLGKTGVLRLPAGCRVAFESPAMTVATAQASVLHVSDDHVAVERGWAVFEVEHREKAPLLVAFDGGTIEVLGTTFSVFQDLARGHVELVEGRVRIREASGRTQLLDPGERFAWKRAADGEATPRARRPPHDEGDGLIETIDDVARLRSKKEYRRARGLLRRLRARAKDRHEREVLDYELGTVLEAEGASEAKRCEHWDSFVTRYPSSRYTTPVETRRQTLGCQPRRSRDNQ